MVTFQSKNRKMKHMHFFCTAHNHISDSWNNIYGNIMFNTVFQDNISIMTMNTTQKYRFYFS